MGVNNVSDSLLMIDNCDNGIILNKETDSKGNYYMGISSIKSRTKCDVEIFFQPFMENHGLKLIEDVNSDYPAYKWTLIDKEAGPLRMSNNDYVKISNKRVDDDEDMFSQSNISTVNETVSTGEVSINEIMNPNINVIGAPSIPVYDNYDIQQPIIELVPLQPPTEEMSSWEKELISMKYSSSAKIAFTILGKGDISIGDSVEMFPISNEN